MNSKNKILLVVIIILIAGGLLTLYYSKIKPDKINVVDTPKVIQKKTAEPEVFLPEASSTIVSSTPTDLITKKNTMPIVKIKTNKGDITFELYPADAPKTVENFISLAKKGFYDGVIFHRVIKGFMIQGGDPTGTGSGGPDYKFADELNSNTPSYKLGYVRGTLAMANAGPNTNGSQFFIMHADNPLPHAYTIFGRVTEGLETVDAIAEGEVDMDDRPLDEVVMRKVEVVE